VEQPVTLGATLTDPAVALPGSRLRARVEHAYRAALYVRDEGSGRRAIVAIEDVGGLPGGILVRGATDLRAVASEGRTVVVDLSAAVAWSPRLPAAARLVVGFAGAPLAGEGFEARSGDPFATAATAQISALRSALLAGEIEAAEKASVALIGLGIGLTPSGDDFLVGLLAGLEATDNGMREPLARAIGREAPGRTTAFGADVLEHACRGEFSQRLHDVLIAMASKDAAGLERAICRATAYGATSGADTLMGLFAALDVAATRAGRGRIAA
jgi:uncharacterized protein DUF2877